MLTTPAGAGPAEAETSSLEDDAWADTAMSGSAPSAAAAPARAAGGGGGGGRGAEAGEARAGPVLASVSEAMQPAAEEPITGPELVEKLAAWSGLLGVSFRDDYEGFVAAALVIPLPAEERREVRRLLAGLRHARAVLGS